MILMALERTTMVMELLINKIVSMRIRIMITILLLIMLTINSCSCCRLFGDNKLGDNFSLLEGDKTEDRMIVYCTGKSAGCCYAGIPVIPSRSDSLSLYVSNAVHNDKWIIATTINKNKTENYWIIDKDFKLEFQYDDGGKLYDMLQKLVIGPLDKINLQQEKERLGIKLAINE